MKYGLVIELPARLDMEAIARWIARDSETEAQRWYRKVRKAVSSLQTLPHRAPLAPEAGNFQAEIRHLIFGRGRGSYRIIFTINGDTVHVLHIRHGSRLPLT